MEDLRAPTVPFCERPACLQGVLGPRPRAQATHPCADAGSVAESAEYLPAALGGQAHQCCAYKHPLLRRSTVNLNYQYTAVSQHDPGIAGGGTLPEPCLARTGRGARREARRRLEGARANLRAAGLLTAGAEVREEEQPGEPSDSVWYCQQDLAPGACQRCPGCC